MPALPYYSKQPRHPVIRRKACIEGNREKNVTYCLNGSKHDTKKCFSVLQGKLAVIIMYFNCKKSLRASNATESLWDVQFQSEQIYLHLKCNSTFHDDDSAVFFSTQSLSEWDLFFFGGGGGGILIRAKESKALIQLQISFRSYSQFHQHLTSSFCTDFFLSKNYKHKL